MPTEAEARYNGSERPDREGTDLADMGGVRSEAVRPSGEVLRDVDDRLWCRPEQRLIVTDETGAEALGLRLQGRSLAESSGRSLSAAQALA